MAMTFTNKAAYSMREKLCALSGETRANEVVIGTFHALALRTLRRWRDSSQPFLQIISESGQERIIRFWCEQKYNEANDALLDEILNLEQKKQKNNPDFNLLDEKSNALGSLREEARENLRKRRVPGLFLPSRERLAKFIQAAKELEIPVGQPGWEQAPKVDYLIEHLDIEGSEWVFEMACTHYQETLQQEHRMDFQDILLKTRDLLRDNREAREDMMTRARYILLDEAQDTDPLQYEILQWMTRDAQ